MGPGGQPPGQPGAPQQEDALKKLAADFQAAPPLRKAIYVIFPLAMIAAAVMLLSDDPPAPQPAKKPDAGAEAGALASGLPEAGPDLTQAQPQIPVPVPVPTPAPTPSGGGPTPPTPTPSASAAAADAGAKGAHVATLERRAIDEVFRGDIAKAAETYEQLAREQPQNPSYAYAAKILRERQAAAGGGAPPPTAPPPTAPPPTAPPPAPGAPR
jgi:hypothetical protein